MEGNAVIKGNYRYTLTRRWGQGSRVMFMMLNPSTATGDEDDNTIRRCIGFSNSLGAESMTIINAFSYRSSSPDDLKLVADPVGPETDIYIESAIAETRPFILAFGNGILDHPQRAQQLREIFANYNRLWALKLTAKGLPSHPLYLPKDTQPFRVRVDLSSPTLKFVRA